MCVNVCMCVCHPPSPYIHNPWPILSPSLSVLLPQHGCRMAALWTLSVALCVCLLRPLCSALTPPAQLPQPHNLPPAPGFNSSDGSLSVDVPMALRVFSVDYHHVQAPFEIVLWIMLASLAKLGKLLCSDRKSQHQVRCD